MTLSFVDQGHLLVKFFKIRLFVFAIFISLFIYNSVWFVLIWFQLQF